MKRTLIASAAAVLVSSSLMVSPAAAAVTPTAGSVISPTSQIQIEASSKYSGVLSTTGMGTGAKIFFCWFRKC